MEVGGEILSPAATLAPLFGWTALGTSVWLVLMILGVVLLIVDWADRTGEDEWEWCAEPDCTLPRE